MHLIMAGRKEDKDLSKFIVGTCMGMCPNAELRLRQREQLIHPLEMAVDSSGKRLNYAQPRAMIKEFSRSAAGHEIKASDIRPVAVLVKTVKYLLTSLCSRKDVPWALVYQFIDDRLRAIRQDLCVQGVKNITCIQLQQASVRFYVYSNYRTCEHELCDFDPYLNNKHLAETLATVISWFEDLDKEDKQRKVNDASLADASSFCNHSDESDSHSDESDQEEIWNASDDDANESKILHDAETSEKDTILERTVANEEASLKISEDSCVRDQDSCTEGSETVRNVSEAEEGIGTSTHSARTSSGITDGNKCDVAVSEYSVREEAEALYLLVHFGNEEALMHILKLPKHIRCSRLVSVATEMSIAWLTHNYCRVLRLSTFLPPLLLCALHPHLTQIQRKALGILSRAHCCKGLVYKQEDLATILCFPSSHELVEACKHYGLTVVEGGVSFMKGAFNWDSPLMKPCRLKWIDDKLATIHLHELFLPQGLSL
ncbi:uncharacterized protein [Panulirus ornatus]|uniref:uncharacterized protein n=1 Tax=Panulirus ornatus TaxID=150431 RepID=UPI003A8B5156